LIILDIDHCKLFNDTYGHVRGDDCLRDVAGVVQRTLHQATDLAARYGGEEFAYILPNTNSEQGARSVAERIRRGRSRNSPFPMATPQPLTMSPSVWAWLSPGATTAPHLPESSVALTSNSTCPSPRVATQSASPREGTMPLATTATVRHSERRDFMMRISGEAADGLGPSDVCPARSGPRKRRGVPTKDRAGSIQTVLARLQPSRGPRHGAVRIATILQHRCLTEPRFVPRTSAVR